MKGIILSGGSGSRLLPLTKVTSKQLLPIYNKPMIYYPLNTLIKAGIKDIMIIISPEHSGDYVNLLGSGKQFGAKFTYEVQDKPEGLAQAFLIAEDFIEDENVAMILGDNIFTHDFSESIKNFKSGAKVFAKKVKDPERFGVVEFDENKKVISIEEKPKYPKSNFAQVGFYIYDNKVVERTKNLQPSKRGELEIVDLANIYLNNNELEIEELKGEWIDAGTFESLHKASIIARENQIKSNQIKIDSIDVKVKKIN